MDDRQFVKNAAASVTVVTAIAETDLRYAYPSLASRSSGWSAAACFHASWKTKTSSTPMPTMTKSAMKLKMPMKWIR